MKKSIAILIIIGALLAIITESTPTQSRYHSEEAHHNPALQIEIIENDRVGWAIAHVGMGVGGLIVAIGLVLFAREFPNVSDNKNIQMTGNLGVASAALGALVHLFVRFNDAFRPFDNPNPDWGFPTYSILTRLAIFIIGFILIQTGYSKKLGLVMIAISIPFMILFGIHGPPATYTLSFLVMGITLGFKRSPSLQELPQTA